MGRDRDHSEYRALSANVRDMQLIKCKLKSRLRLANTSAKCIERNNTYEHDIQIGLSIVHYSELYANGLIRLHSNIEQHYVTTGDN